MEREKEHKIIQLEDVYWENYISPVHNTTSPKFEQRTKLQKIQKIQGLLSSLKLELNSLKQDATEEESNIINLIDQKLETPHHMFDRYFFTK